MFNANMSSPFMTKHTDEEGIKYLRKGSVRVGTLIGYTKTERDALSIDGMEGVLSVAVLDPPEMFAFTSPALGVEDMGFLNCGQGPRCDTIFDEWVFCASNGEYDRERHEKIVYGDGDYKGNKEYTEYAVLDKKRFYDALNEAVERKMRCKPKSVAALVTYCDPIRNVSIEDFENNISGPAFEREIFKRIFEKDPYFTIEEEIRLALRLPAHDFDTDILDIMVVQSDSLASSIVQSGSLT